MEVLAFAVALIILVYLILFLNTTGDSKSDSIGKAGEREVASVLRSLPQDYHVINDVIIPDQRTLSNKKYTTQIDHVVVSPFGIFVIETKNYSGWIFGEEKSKQWKQTFKTTEAQYLYNPIKQNWGHIFALAEHLHLKTSLFKPIIVFSDSCELHVDSTTPVIHNDQLNGLIRSYTQEIIPRDDVVEIFNRLNSLDMNGEDIEKGHIQSIGERRLERERTLAQGKCPRCGGNLVLRNGKYGAFYGCSNYPRCRFTHDRS